MKLSSRLKITLASLAIISGMLMGLNSPAVLQQIGQWTTAKPLSQVVSDGAIFPFGDAIYMAGGRSASNTPLNTILRGQLDAFGELTNWSAARPLPIPLFYHQAVVANADIFVTGGWDGKQLRSEIWHAQLSSDGSIGNWNKASDYPTAIDLHGAAIVNNRLYIVGGWNGTDSLSTVRYADIIGGNLAQWQTTSLLPVKLYRFSISVYNNYLYVSGGVMDKATLVTDVYYAKINVDGSVGLWSKTTPLPAPRNLHASVVHDGRLVVIGGLQSLDAGSEQVSVLAAPIAADGRLGVWTPESTIPIALHGLSAISLHKNAEDFIYIAGGRQNSNYQSQVYHSTLPSTPTTTMTDTPIVTPTPIPTLTPTPGIQAIRLSNDPQGELRGGDEVTYTIELQNGTFPLAQVVVSNAIPEQMELATGSIKAPVAWTTEVADRTIRWMLPSLPASDTVKLVYRAQRHTPTVTPTSTIAPTLPPTTPTPTTSLPTATATLTASPTVIQPTGPGTPTQTATATALFVSTTPTASPTPSTLTATPTAASTNLTITKSGPAAVPVGSDIVYTLRITNHLARSLTGLTIFDLIPVGAEVVDFGGGSTTMPPASMIQWQVASLNPENSVTRNFTIRPTASVNQIRNELYFVDVIENGQLVMRAVGQTPVVTTIGSRALVEQSDFLGAAAPFAINPPIINEGALVKWTYLGLNGQQLSNRVQNPFELYLPVIAR